MNRKWTGFAAVVLVLALVLTLGGCGASEKETLLGTWKGETDITDLVNRSLTAGVDEELAGFLTFDNVTLVVVLTFREDDSFSMALDETALETTVEQMKADFAGGMEQFLVKRAAAEGKEASLEEILDSMDTTMEELVNEAITSDLVNTLAAGIAREGAFRAENGTLYLSGEEGKEIPQSYALKGGTLTLGAPKNSQELDIYLQAMYPMVFQKAE